MLCAAALVLSTAASAEQHIDRSPYGQALRWYFEAAEQGNPQAQFLLGLKYETGTDVARDFVAAADWYERAARQGYAEAQFKLAILVQHGQGRAADAAAAEHWYRESAQQGYAPAQYNLAVMLLNAARSDAERVDALVWLVKAHDQKFAAAGALLSRIEEQWPAELVADARQRAADIPARQPARQ